MTKKLTFGLILSLGLATTAFAQQGRVGINTTDPAATFDVVAKNTDPAVVDGVIAPRLTGNELKAKDAVYLGPQTGALVYATAAASPTTFKTINVTFRIIFLIFLFLIYYLPRLNTIFSYKRTSRSM